MKTNCKLDRSSLRMHCSYSRERYAVQLGIYLMLEFEITSVTINLFLMLQSYLINFPPTITTPESFSKWNELKFKPWFQVVRSNFRIRVVKRNNDVDTHGVSINDYGYSYERELYLLGTMILIFLPSIVVSYIFFFFFLFFNATSYHFRFEISYVKITYDDSRKRSSLKPIRKRSYKSISESVRLINRNSRWKSFYE